MNFLEKLFAWLFGGGNAKPTQRGVTELRFDEVGPFLESRAAQKSEVVDKEVPAKFAEIKHTIRETKALLESLEKEEIGEDGNKRFRKAAKTAKDDSIRKMSAVLERIQPPFTDDVEKIRDYSYESLELLDKKVRSNSKNIAYTSFILKDTMREIGKKVDALENSLKSLIETIRKNDFLFQKKSLMSAVEEVKQEKAELLRAEEKISALEKTLESIEKNSKAAKAALERTMNSGSAQELQALESRKKEILLEKAKLREKFVETVLCMERPLKKLANLSEKGLYSLDTESENTLSLFLREPGLLYKRDTKGESFKKLLKALKETIVSEKIDLAEKERAKALENIEELLSVDFFSDFFWKENSLEKSLRETEAKEKTISVKAEIDSANKEIESFDRDSRETTVAMNELRREAENRRKKIAESLRSLGATLSSLTGEKVEIAEVKELFPRPTALRESD
ncbi:MAG: hypothetical protein NT067_04520 [Candidatus Diapherotrites archaeon]|nr:hypothetical protein [Candidatus Diapherotrites archaeon]